MRDLAQRNPGFREAVVADASITARFRGERYEFRSGKDAAVQAVRLAVVSDAFLAQACYRAKAAMQRRGIPILPRIMHRLAMGLAQISIGDPVLVNAGVYIIHGQVVFDGLTEIGAGCAIAPWTSIGLQSGHYIGPTIGQRVMVGTGSKLLGEFTVGDDAAIGANAVVTKDVPPATTVVGIPARPV